MLSLQVTHFLLIVCCRTVIVGCCRHCSSLSMCGMFTAEKFQGKIRCLVASFQSLWWGELYTFCGKFT